MIQDVHLLHRLKNKEWHARWMLTEFVMADTFQKFLLVKYSNSVFGTAHAKLSVFIYCGHTSVLYYKVNHSAQNEKLLYPDFH